LFTFAFATGIENSAPTIHGGRRRVDELEKCGFYTHWRTDFALVKELGVDFLRFGPPIHLTWLGPDRYDWEFSDLTFAQLKRQNTLPIVDLCHFGAPDWIGDFQNPDFPAQFARYARAFARRYPWVQLYNPVNEMFVCASFSARLGRWNEQLTGERPFVTALKHLVRANILAMRAILEIRPDALFIQSESSEYFHPESPAAVPWADRYNAQRFLSLDLNYGRSVDAETYSYLLDNGVSAKEYQFFMREGLPNHCIMGNDYYPTNEHWVAEDGALRTAGEVFGYSEITREYFERYRLPVMHTETNVRMEADEAAAVLWLKKQWANVLRLRRSGIPVLGFTWYSLTDQVDWDSALTLERGQVNHLGLFGLDRQPRQVGLAFKALVRDWKASLARQSACLTLPVIMPDENDSPAAEAQGRRARRLQMSATPTG
jgi:beta-glucosidase